VRTFDRRSWGVLVLASVLAATVAMATVPRHASAVPLTNSAIEAKRKEAQAAQIKLDDLSAQLEARFEELAQIEGQLQETRARIDETQADLASATAELQRSQARLDGRAIAIYRNGPADYLAVFVGATDFGDFISRLDLMRRIGLSDAAMVVSVKDARAKVQKAERALEAQEAEQIALRDQARAKRAQYQKAFDEQKSFLGGLNDQLKKLIEQERIRQEKLAAERAAAQARAAAAARAQVNRAKDLPFDPAKLGEGHPEVVAVAKKYLGVPYVWGGTSPRGFDCSGLTQYSYAEIGVSIPRTSREQFRIGAYIPPSRLDLLKAGDLVFFGFGGDPDQIHHVGIYVGGGDFIHAPASGDVVRITSLNGRIADRGDYVGAVRP
jgi:peptidoglycan DL-endopeptidase CwlO